LKWPSLSLLVAAALVSGEPAAVEKCVGPDGKISYLDICPADSTRAPAKTDEQLIPKPGAGTSVIKPEIKPTPEPASGPVTVRPIPPPPPPPAATPAEVLAPVLPDVPADVQLSYYDVEGSDQASLLAALNARGATQGQASWKLSYQYVPKRDMRECAVGSVSAKLELGMTLPRWTPLALAAVEPARDCASLDAAVKERYAALEEKAKAKAQEPAAELVFE